MHVSGSCDQTPEVGSSPAWMFELRAHRDGEAHAWTVVSRRICGGMSFHSSHLVRCNQRVSLRSVLSKFKSVFSGQETCDGVTECRLWGCSVSQRARASCDSPRDIERFTSFSGALHQVSQELHLLEGKCAIFRHGQHLKNQVPISEGQVFYKRFPGVLKINAIEPRGARASSRIKCDQHVK